MPDINDMRCGAHRLLEIVKHKHHLCTDNGDVFIFMSKNQRTVKMVNFVFNYLNSFLNQFILYLKDGRYNIDNSLAERALRTLTVERKNSLTFGSHAGVEISVIYHTFIQTCKMCGVSTLEYFKKFFTAIMQGRTDYENMLPMTIGLKINNF